MSMLKLALEARDAKQAELDALLKVAEDEKRTALTDDETAKFNEIRAELTELDERIGEYADAEKREQAAAETRKLAGQTVAVGDGVRNEPNPVYRRDDPTAPSFFRDLAAVQKPMSASFDEARGRLIAAQERRALSNSVADVSTAAGTGGEFAPPLWLVDEFVTLARPGRVTADLMNRQGLPSGVSSVNLPKVSSGTDADIQQTQGTTVTDVAMTTTSVSSGIVTVAGKQIVPVQLLQQSGVAFDRVVLQDLAKAYAVRMNKQVLYGSNANGQLRGLVGVAVTNSFTTTTPAVASATSANSLYYVVSKAGAAVQTALLEPADAIVMHPLRWAWILGSVDSQSRPLIVPRSAQFNGAGTADAATAQGHAGTFGQYDVYLDPSISLTANGSSGTTAQDEIYVVRRDEHWLYESPVQSASFEATYADELSVLYRVHGYAAFIPHRRAGSAQAIRGTGLLLPA